MTVTRLNRMLALALVLAGPGVAIAEGDAASAEVAASSAFAGQAVVGQDEAASPQPDAAAIALDAPAADAGDVALGAGAKEKPAGRSRASAKKDAPDVAAEDRPLIQTLGEADQKIFLVDHRGKWSMHFENVITGNIVLLWRKAGGPDVTMKQPVDRTFTMSVHELEPELIVERLFEGYGYTLHYDDDGRLDSVRVYSPRADAAAFKTPRLTEPLSRWKEIETEGPEASEPKPE